jgi:nitroreductase
MNILDLAKKRKSIRKYQTKQIEKEKLEYVLEVAKNAPSACNNQPWQFIVIQTQEKLAEIKTCYKRDWIKQAPTIIAICGNHETSWKRKDTDNKDHLDIDIAIAIDHMTLAATEQGLGTCWVCAFNENKCAEILNLPENIEPIALLPIGYPLISEEPIKRTPRKELSETTTWI